MSERLENPAVETHYSGGHPTHATKRHPVGVDWRGPKCQPQPEADRRRLTGLPVRHWMTTASRRGHSVCARVEGGSARALPSWLLLSTLCRFPGFPPRDAGSADLQHGAQLSEHLGANLVDHTAPVPATVQQPGLGHHLEVVRDRWLAQLHESPRV